MKKKNYIRPNMEVVIINVGDQLLAGSGDIKLYGFKSTETGDEYETDDQW